MDMNTFTFSSVDSKEIFVRSWLPDSSDDLNAVVQIAHGMAEHSERYGEFARTLVDVGFGVYANDHRGHGRTADSSSNLGYFADDDGWNLVVEDMHRLTQTVDNNHPGLPRFLFGHSMGSFLSLDYISRFAGDLKGVVLSGTTGDPGLLGNMGIIVAKLECWIKDKKAKSPLLDKLTFGGFNKSFRPNRTDFDWLSRDAGAVDKYIEDPLCGEICTCGFYLDLLKGIKKIHSPKVINSIPNNLPIHLIAGNRDPVSSNAKGVMNVYNALVKSDISDVTYKLYEDGRHEMLNETNKKEVFNDLIDWFKSHV